jgi:oligopeptide transport system ATP-binding protein
MTTAVLEVKDLRVEFLTEDGWLTAVDGLSYTLGTGETLGIVGESGSGKSVTNLAVMGLLPKDQSRTGGQVLFEGRDLLRAPEAVLRRIRGNRISMIFQDPMTSLNPFLKVSVQLGEVLTLHRKLPSREVDRLCIEMLERVGIPDASNRYTQYPHQYSGGMRQRVMIAMMLLNRPAILIADEPTTALDVTIQAQVLDLLRDLQSELQTAITLITHDLGVVAGMAKHVIVMYAGRAMESGTVDEILKRPAHPYTLGLLRSLPRLDEGGRGRLQSIPGRPPDLHARPTGCPFAPRCAFAVEECRRKFPPRTELSPTHVVHCFETEVVQAQVVRGEHLQPVQEVRG